jgi:hypothetical protein
MSWRNDQSTAQERVLQQQVDDLRAEQERAWEREDREREQRRRERGAEIAQSKRYAKTWPEALRKQTRLYGEEVALSEEDGRPDKFFTESVAACEKALELWPAIEKSNQAEIKRLEAELDAVRDSIRLEVADRLVAFNGCRAFENLAGQLRDGDIEEFLNW